MSKSISIRITEATQGRFFTLKTKQGGTVNGKLNKLLTSNSNKFIYINRSHDGTIKMVHRNDVIQINGERCKIAIEG
jgi:hypothetical protein